MAGKPRIARWITASLLVGAAMLVGGACGSPPRRDCFARVWVSESAADVRVRGSWDGWRGAWAPKLQEGGGRLLRLALPPGEHQYLLERGAELFVDPANPLTSFREADGTEVSSLLVGDCTRPSIAVWTVAGERDGTATIEAQLLASNAEEPLDETTIVATTASGDRLSVDASDPSEGTFTLRASGLGRGKHVVTIEAADAGGTAAEAARVAVFVDPIAPRWNDGILYQIMIDRYRGDGGTPLSSPSTPGSRAGGTLDGVLSELEAGTFDELGVSALWLSPVYVNPDAAREGADGNLYEGYHGYWPLESRSVDERIGGDDALHALVDAAHARGMKVILDLVPNHVYEDNALYADKRGAGWFSPEGCVCGSATCSWAEHIQDCWFTPYLPDIRWQAPGTLGHAADEARFWYEGFDIDGFRIDAVPMMPRAATRRIARELRTTTDPREATFLLGEVFTGPEEGALQQLATFLGPDTLDSVFDFPLMWAIRGAAADGKGGFDHVESILAAGDERFAGSGAVMAHMLDNHDTTRFLSVANGDAAADPWGASPSAQPTTDEPYARLELGLAAILTLPGLPVFYYGDEVGLAGGGDPDSRRVMPAEDALSERQKAVREVARKLGKLRRCSTALRQGARVPIHAEPRVWAFLRGEPTADDAVIVAMHASTGPSSATIATDALLPGTYVDVLSGTSFELGPGAPLEVPPLTARVLVSAGSPCL